MKLIILAFQFLLMALSPDILPREFQITPDDTLGKKLPEIIAEINQMPGEETVIIRMASGRYSVSGAVKLEEGCTHPVIVRGSSLSPVIICGSVPVSGWEVMPDGIWRTHLTPDLMKSRLPDQLFVNGERAVRARTPNEGVFKLTSGKDTTINKQTLHSAVLSEKDFGSLGKKEEKEDPIVTVFRKWTVSKGHAAWGPKRNRVVEYYGSAYPEYNKLEKGNKLVVENYRAAMDVPGEWYVDKEGWVYYLPMAGQELQTTEFRIPMTSRLLTINMKGKKFAGLRFENVVFEQTRYTFGESGYEPGQAAAGMSAAIEVDFASSIYFENCEFRNLANYAVWFRERCQSSGVLQSYLHALGAGGIKIGKKDKDAKGTRITNGIKVDNNIIHHYGETMQNAVAVLLLNASDCKITHNDIRKGYYSAISLGWVWGYATSPSVNNEVAFNKIAHIGQGLLNDMGGIYTLGPSEGTTIHDNVIVDVTSGNDLAWGMYADEGTSGVVYENNLAYRCTSGGFHQHYGSKNVIRNNIFAFGLKNQFTLTAIKEEMPLTFTNNIIVMDKGSLFAGEGIKSDKYKIGSNCYWNVSGPIPAIVGNKSADWMRMKDPTSVVMDPGFRDAANGDFRIVNRVAADKIGFVPFDYTSAGVYGSRTWQLLAESE